MLKLVVPHLFGKKRFKFQKGLGRNKIFLFLNKRGLPGHSLKILGFRPFTGT